MKKLFTIALIFSAFVVQAQSLPKLERTDDENITKIVVTVDSMTASQIYKSTLNWVKVYYGRGSTASQGFGKTRNYVENEIENERIMFKSRRIKRFGKDMSYKLDIEFNNAKMRLTFVWGGTLFAHKGKRSEFMNEFVQSLYAYLKGKKDDW